MFRRRSSRYSERAPFTDRYRDLERKRLQSDVLAMIRAREARSRLVDWAASWEQRREPAHAQAVRAQRTEYFAMLLDVQKMMTPAQRESVQRRLGDLAADFDRLSRP